MDLEAVLQEGISHHSAGRLGDAARCYALVLNRDPGNPDACHLMSILALAAEEHATARELAETAIKGQPDWFAPYVSLGNVCQSEGNHLQAIDAFQKAITLNAQCAEAYSNLSNALMQVGRAEDAANAAVNAIVIDGALAEAHNNFGNALLGLESASEACEAYVKAIALRPDFSEAWYNLGNAKVATGEYVEAVSVYRKAIELQPSAAKHYNLANTLARVGRFDEALASFHDVLALDPRFLAAGINLSSLLKQLERLDEAEAVLRRFLEHYPDETELHWNLSLALLQAGKFREGWAEYEWRWKTPSFRLFARDFGRPEWTGGDLSGKSILVHAEQGFGDAIEFCRFVPRLADLGAEVVFECRKGLVRVFKTIDPRIKVVGLGNPLPDTDLHVPMMSLAHRLGVELDGVTPGGPYLSVPEGVGDFSDVASASGRKIGLVWAGGGSRRDNADRSCEAADFLPLLDVAGCRFFSLQVGPFADQVQLFGDKVVDLSSRLTDFAETAAAIAQMDLVISVDTAVVHMAGALGKPVWVLLSKPSNGFLWMLGRDDSPWYPNACLFRQIKTGDWRELISRVRGRLEQ
jgi:tetratricopeptide (TPR) repeat protein